jgi:hypothetical protein
MIGWPCVAGGRSVGNGFGSGLSEERGFQDATWPRWIQSRSSAPSRTQFSQFGQVLEVSAMGLL